MTNDRLCAEVAAEAEVEIMTVEHNGTDLVFTPSSLSSSGTSDGQNRQNQTEGRGWEEETNRKTNSDITSLRDYNR